MGIKAVKLRVISRQSLRNFWEQKGKEDSEGPLKSWLSEAEKAEWSSPQEVKDQYGNASIIANNRVVFNIKGNDYRLIVQVQYAAKIVWIKFVGTHQEYDAIEATTVSIF